MNDHMLLAPKKLRIVRIIIYGQLPAYFLQMRNNCYVIAGEI